MINFKHIKHLLSTTMTLMLFSLVITSCDKLTRDKGKSDLGVVVDLSDPETSGVDIKEFSVENNALVIKTTEDKLPEKGEYLISGITDAAPMGFLLKTVDVHNIGNDSYVVTTQPATLGEVLRAEGIKFQGWITPESKKETKGLVVLDESIAKEPIVKIPLTLDLFSDDGKQSEKATLTVNEELYYLQDNCGFYVDSEDDEKTGFEMSFLHSETWNIKGKVDLRYKPKKEEDWLKKRLGQETKLIKSYLIGYIGAVPIIVTPKIEVKIPLNFTGTLDCNMDLYKSSRILHVGAMWDGGPKPKFSNGEYIYMEDVEIPEELLPQSQQSASKMTLSAKASIKPTISVTIGLYGGNLTTEEKLQQFTNSDLKYSDYIKEDSTVEYLTLGADFWVEGSLEAKIGAQWGGYDAPKRYRNDFRFIDSFSAKLDCGITVKATAWKIKSKLINFELAGEHKFGPYSIVEISFPLLYKDISKIKLTLVDDKIKVTGQVTDPYLCPLNLDYSFGLCLEKYGGDFFRSYEIESKTFESGYRAKFDYTLPYKFSDLEKGKTYAIYPYVETGPIPSTIYRKGVTFVPLDNGLSFNAIDDVPGQNF